MKFSVESSVESLISRYECHFDKSRQLSQERSTQEMFLSENGPILVGISYHVLFHDYINITICMALLLCEEILRLLYNRCMQTSCSRERWTSSLSVKPIVQHGIFTIQMWQGFMNQTIPKPSKGCKLEIKIELCWQIGEHVKWDDNDSEFLTTTNNAVWLKKFKFVLWHLCNWANIIFEFTNLCITTYLNKDQTYPAHWQCDTAQTWCHNVFSLFSLKTTFSL